MKKTTTFISLALGSFMFFACSEFNIGKVTNPITIEVPVPTDQITKVALDETQLEFVKAGNSMGLRFLNQIYEGENLICSPLSLQYALAMIANGASGETLNEITDFLGYGKGNIDILNRYSKILIEQFPALDLEVTLKVTDAMLVNDHYKLKNQFKKTVEDHYYAAVESTDFSNPAQTAARINEWASRSTNGFIDKVLDPDEVLKDAMIYIMNALYFKAPWQGSKSDPIFNEKFTKPGEFHLSDGSNAMVDMMVNTSYHQYAEMEDYNVLVLPYAGGKFNMYILLPDENNVQNLIDKLDEVQWNEIRASLKQDAEVSVRLPKFEIENKHELSEALMALGLDKCFTDADFDKIFESPVEEKITIGKVIQKSKIVVTEWGTEAGSVTITAMPGAAEPGDDIKNIEFHADHPFVFIIGEENTGTILFEGVFAKP